MTKKVFENSMVAHVWAQQNQDEGRSNNGQLYFDGKTIYSYGRHYPAGYVVDENTVLINSDKYSITTSKHLGYVYSAVRGKYQNIFSVPKLAEWIWAIQHNSPDSLARLGYDMQVDALNVLFGREKTRQLINKRDSLEKTKYAAERKAFRAEVMRDLKAVKSGYRGDRLFGAYVSVSRHSGYTPHYIALTEAQNCLKATTAAQRKASASEYNYPSLEAQLKALASKLRAKVKQRKAEFVKGQFHARLRTLFGYIRTLREAPLEAPHPSTVRNLAYELGVWNKPRFAALQDELMRVDAYVEKQKRLAELKTWKRNMRNVLAFSADPSAYMRKETPNSPTRYVPGYPSRVNRLVRETGYNGARRVWEENARSAYEAAKSSYNAAKSAIALKDWLAGFGNAYCSDITHTRGSDFAYMRVRGNNVETSRGASVPLDSALRLYRFMKALKQPWLADRANPVRVGSFTLEYVRDNVAKIGCHKLHFDDIEAAYKAYSAMVTA